MAEPLIQTPLARLQALQDAYIAEPNWARLFGHDLGSLAVNIVVAVVIIVATSWTARWAATAARRGLAAAQHGKGDVALQSFVGSLVRYVVLVVGVAAALQQLGVKTTSVLAVLGAASIAVGLALQGALANVAAGVMILLLRPYRVGDLIETGGKLGVVKALDLFVTELATPDNVKVIAPNGKVFGDVIVNWTAHEKRRVDVVFHVDPKQDLGVILDDLKLFLAEDPRVLKTPAPIVEAMALTELYAEGAVRAWVKSADHPRLRSDLVLQAQKLALRGSTPR